MPIKKEVSIKKPRIIKKTKVSDEKKTPQRQSLEELGKSMSESFTPNNTSHKKTTSQKKSEEVEEVVRVVPLGGLEEVGRNMMFFEYKDEIIVVDAGLQFPIKETPGVDFIIPNTEYLAKNKHKVKALIITHGHYDHIGALPFIIGPIGNPTVYTCALPKEMIVRRQKEYRNAPKLDVDVIKPGDTRKLGKYFEAEFFQLEHTIPDTIGTVIKTPIGNICYFTDFKLDYTTEGDTPIIKEFERIGKQGIHTLVMDSTNAWKEGRTVSERLVEKNISELIEKSPGRIVIATFASLLTRLYEIIKIAQQQKRKIFIGGFSMKTNIQIAQNLGYMKIPKDVIIPLEEMHKYNDDKIIFLCTGAQGESNAQLMRIATGEHNHFETKEGDTFILSSSAIPGNEVAIQTLKDLLTRQGGRVMQSSHMDIHSSGHATKEEIKDAVNAIKPRFILPAHGQFFMRAANRDNAVECGIKKENVIMLDNGQVGMLTKETAKATQESIESSYVLVDGLGVGDVGEIVLRDRRMLAEEGMIVIIATMRKHDSRLLKNPDIISRGFIYLKENREIMDEMRKKIRIIIENQKTQGVDVDYLKSLIRDQIGSHIFRKTQRRPMILPVIIEI